MFDETMEQFLGKNGKGHISGHYKEYSKEVIQLLKIIYSYADRFLLRTPQILSLLDETLKYLSDCGLLNNKEQIEQQMAIKKEIIKFDTIKELQNKIDDLNDEIYKLRSKMLKKQENKVNITELANQLNISRQALYSFINKHRGR